ncbi:MAG: ring-cleaving dioxygenase [Gemmatimonadetes bacterium]|nr:ring-cleaving dioxygenase [Gemmatimonadota bacterium]
MTLLGLHHVTAITGDAPVNLHFYRDVLGLRLVKKTVNQDDVSAYHLFYADAKGTPGTDVTFFDWPRAVPHRAGVSDISRIGLRVPAGALGWWRERLIEMIVEHDEVADVAGRPTLHFSDPEGQRLALVATDEPPLPPAPVPWTAGGVESRVAIRGLGPITLTVRRADSTVVALTELLGFSAISEVEVSGGRDLVLRLGEAGAAGELRIEERHALPMMRQGRGGVHHVAFRTRNDASHHEWLDRLERAGVPNSGIVDRFYFRSLYFREPNGILFELATDGPGFSADEPVESLGAQLALPPFLEPHRASIEAGLVPLNST